METKTFPCRQWFRRDECKITDVQRKDSDIELTFSSYQSYDAIKKLTISNSTMDDILPILPDDSVKLNYLSCVGCGLANIAEQSFTNFSDLEALDISFGSYKKFQPNLFSHLRSLKHLDARHGAINEIDETAFNNLSKLELVYLLHNNITEITPKMFGSLESLIWLDLSYNHIKILDENIFANNTRLVSLNLGHNDISKIDGRLFNPKSVVSYVYLSYNKLKNLHSDNFNAGSLWVDHNELQELFVSSTLRYLDASQNDIYNVTCDEEGSAITFLDLTNNSLTNLGCIDSLTELTKLSLNYNNLGKLNQSSFAELTELTDLSLRATNIGSLDYGIFSHQNKLELLDISYNKMGDIALEKLLAARGLQTLFVDGNNLTEFSYDDLKTMFTSFETIGIADNDFNCTFLAQAIKQMNSNYISAVISSGNKVTDSHNIIGIGCEDKKETTTPPSNTLTTDNEMVDALNAISQQVKKLSQMITENDKKFKELSDDKDEIVRMESSIQSSDTSKSNSNSGNDLTRSVNIVLITLIVAFCFYKVYQFVRKGTSRVRRCDTLDTVYTNIEMENSFSK